MEPRIRYAKTSDGVSIAYWTLGEGIPLVHMPQGVFSHIELESRVSYLGATFEPDRRSVQPQVGGEHTVQCRWPT